MQKSDNMDVKIGLELHQRLNTKHKLFCNCSTKGNEIKTREIKRKFHAVPSELGQIDPAALFESKKSPMHIYDFYKDTCCLVETDDEPPHNMNREAIEIGVMICNMFDAEIIDEIHVMRKTVIDGSNTSGFQRTAIIGLNGKLKYKFDDLEKTIGIQTIAIEEESCGIIGEQKGEIERYRLDRLGIPLVEIATTPDIKSGKEAKFVAEQIGLMLRATGKMMRGIGTIRQDINLSIPGGARVEIKGIQELDLIEKVIDNEINRQKTLITIIEKIKEIKNNKEKNDEIEKMKENKDSYIKDLTDIFKETKNNFIRKAIENKKKVMGMKFPGLRGIFGIELYPDYRYGSELSDYAKTQGVGGIIHCDEDTKKYSFNKEIEEVEKQLGISEDEEMKDGWILIVGEEEKVVDALKLVFDRAYLLKVPEETRRADIQGKTHYMRPLPGAARMYPETDVPPIKLEKQMKEIKAPSFKEIEEKVYSILNKEMAQKIIRSEKLNLFLDLVDFGIDPTIAAVTLEDSIKAIKREGYDISLLEEEEIKKVLILYKEEKITKAAIIEVIKEIIRYKSINKQTIQELKKDEIYNIAEEHKLIRISGERLKQLINNDKIKNLQELMIKYRINVDPKEAIQYLK